MNPHIEWETHEFHHNPKSADWFWAVGIIVVTGAVVAFIFNNIIFGIFLLIAGFALAVHANAKPDVMYYAITDKGIIKGDSLHPFDSLESFWIENLREIEALHPSLKSHILIKTKKSIISIIVIPIHEEVNISELREILLTHLPEEKISEPLHIKIMERLGF